MGKFGNVGNSSADYSPLQNRTWHEIKFDAKEKQVIAVRYANYSAEYLNSIGISPGFAIYITTMDLVLQNLLLQSGGNKGYPSIWELLFLLWCH